MLPHHADSRLSCDTTELRSEQPAFSRVLELLQPISCCNLVVPGQGTAGFLNGNGTKYRDTCRHLGEMVTFTKSICYIWITK